MKAWVVAFSLMFACIAGRAEAQVKTLEVVTFGGGNNWPVWIATEQGFFAKNNLAVNLTLTPGSVPLMQNLVGRSCCGFSSQYNEGTEPLCR